MRAGIKGVIINDSTAKYMKVINTEEQDRIVAFAKWHMPPPLQPTITSPVPDKLTTKDQLTPATLTNRITALAKLLSSQSSNSRRRIMGNEPHRFLDRLVTDPLYQRRGAAGILLRLMCEAAAERQIPSYLEASPAGFNLYKQHGFVGIDNVKIDLRPWGRMSGYIMTNMIRPAPDSK